MKNTAKLFFLAFLLLLWTTDYGLWTKCGTTASAYAEIPHLINYQGRLTDKEGKPVTDGTYQIIFRIFDAATAGNLLWEETHSSVLIQKGIFSILLGSVTNLNLPFDKPYYLEIKVSDDQPLFPRQLIASAGYAIRAGDVDILPRGVIVMWSGKIADIPSGWALCDGTNGTPDLRDKFIVGARRDDNAIAKTTVSGSFTQNGGEAIHVLTIAEIPAHTHSVGFNDTANSSDGGRNTVSRSNYGTPGGAFVSDSTGAGGAHNNLPPYYALAYIMKL
jgi:microcystin-dependent protein